MTENPASGRLSRTVRQFVKFGLVGGLGVLVNQVVLVLANIVGRDLLGLSDYRLPLFPIPGTAFNVRLYMLYAFLAFLVANLTNFVINRHWTFKGAKAPFLKEYWPFLLVGVGAEVVGQVLLISMLNPTSPFHLSDQIFDDSTGLRTKLYWANLIKIVLVTPVNFVLNKLWTFRAVRNKHAATAGDAAE